MEICPWSISNGMDDLNKTQLILLTLLVNFVTSVTTGIITVSLLDKSPQTATQIINRVVEKTIETVVPAPAADNLKATVVTKEKVRVVNSDDLVVGAIERNKDSLVRIYGFPEGASEANEGEFYGIGIVVSKEGLVLGDSSIVQAGLTYRGNLVDGTRVLLETAKVDRTLHYAVFKIKPLSKDQTLPSWTPATIVGGDTVKIGQTVIAIGGSVKNVIAPGVVTSLIEQQVSKGTTTITSTVGAETNSSLRPLISGSVLVNTSGEIVAVYRYSGEGDGRFTFVPTLVSDLWASSSKGAPAGSR